VSTIFLSCTQLWWILEGVLHAPIEGAYGFKQKNLGLLRSLHGKGVGACILLEVVCSCVYYVYLLRPFLLCPPGLQVPIVVADESRLSRYTNIFTVRS
jgi:hypothetical protein